MTKRDALFLPLLLAALAVLFRSFLFSSGATAFNFGDEYAYHFPLRHLAATSLQAGRLPFWNPYWFAGTPLWANPQSAALYPLSILFQLFPAVPALNALLFAHCALGAVGAYLFFRRAGLGSPGCFLLSAAFSLSPFTLGRVAQGVPTLLASLAWIPWTWLAWLAGRPGGLAVTLALQGLSGHPQFAVANVLGLAVQSGLRGRLLKFAGEGALAGALTLAQAVPTAEFLSHSLRARWSPVFSTGYSLPWRALAGFLSPSIFGTPWKGWAQPPSVWFETGTLYVGLVILGLAAVGLARRPSGGRRPLVAPLLIALGLFIALGESNPAWGLVGWAFRSLRAPCRFAVLSWWGVLLAAALGWKNAAARRPRRAAALIAAGLLELLFNARGLVAAQDARPFLSPERAALAAIEPGWRAATDPDLANPNKLAYYRIPNASGYEAFYLAGAARFASLSEGRAAADASRTYLTRIDTPEMEALSVRYLLTTRDLGTPLARSGPLRIYENQRARPLAWLETDGGPVSVAQPSPERWSLRAPAGTLVASFPFYPGWKAWLDGRPVETRPWRDYLTQLDISSPREHSVELRFTPTAWPLLVLATLAAWLFAAGLALRGAA